MATRPGTTPGRGLWWSHIGWVFRCSFARDYSNVRDLSADRFVAFQHRFYTPLAIVMAAIVPALVACAWHDPLGGFLWRAVFASSPSTTRSLHINSVRPPFGAAVHIRRSRRRATTCSLALLTMGEGYHNFHHSFPYDFRNGARRLDYDRPNGWSTGGRDRRPGIRSETRVAQGDRARQTQLLSIDLTMPPPHYCLFLYYRCSRRIAIVPLSRPSWRAPTYE